jgi:hypothetical protein
MPMTFLQRLKKDLRYGATRSPLGVRPQDFEFPASWEERVRLAMQSEDNARITHVPNAGVVEGDTQIMHNGLRVKTDSYYGPQYTEMLTRNAGVHEPQEERVFAEVLSSIKPGSLMIELGAFWAFYSAWFLSAVPQSRAILVEPMAANLASGRGNLALNDVQDRAELVQGWVGDLDSKYREPGASPIIVDTLLEQRSIARVDVLHADVQGAECRMLAGAQRAIASGKIGWIFVSTHSMHKHGWCKRWLLARGMTLVAEADLPESYSYDGLLVFKRPGEPGPERVEISQRRYVKPA